jgi:hypothetical protein
MKLDNIDQRNEAFRLYMIHSDLRDRWNNGEMAESERLDLRRDMQEALDAYYEYSAENVVDLYFDFNDDPQKCGISGAPILTSEEFVEDVHTGELFLRSALGLPPRPAEPDASDLDQEAA